MNNILDVCSRLTFGDLDQIVVDFIGRGNIWIDNTYDESVYNLTKYIIIQALRKTAPGQLSIVGYDSDLSGVFAPFSSLSAGETKTLKIISDEREFVSYLDYIWQNIVSVQNVIQGRSKSLTEFRHTSGRPIESYKLIVLSIDMGLIDNKIRSKIAMLMRSGPLNGVSFVIVSTSIITINIDNGKTFDLKIEALAPNITVIETAADNITFPLYKKTVKYTPILPQVLIQECEDYINKIRKASLPTVCFDELHDLNLTWMEKSIDGLKFSIGMHGINNMDIIIGDEINQRHNAVITGAVGQGKSNLISMIIHSLCQRYSPKELHMYLLDFKEGVTFKAFSNIGQEEFLPHARALGLESDPSFGLAVLKHLFAEYQNRMKMLKNFNLKSIRELRIKEPELVLPRIIVIIDEFQLMFDDERNGPLIADMLEKSVRLFRAAGIHFILASQTLSDSGNVALSQKKDSLFSQVPIRIALKNSIDESRQTLGANNTAAAFLRPREAIVNLEYGEITQNRKMVVGYADEKILKPLRRKWWEMAKNQSSPPYVFESEKRIRIGSGVEVIKSYRRVSKYPYAFIGQRVAVNRDCVLVPMTREYGRNIAIIGTPDTECNTAYGILQSVAVSLAVQHPKGDVRFLYCNFDTDRAYFDSQHVKFNSLLERMGYFVEYLEPTEFEKTINVLFDDVNNDTVYVFGASMDRWEYEKDPYGQGSPLKSFVENGPAKGIHLIGWWQKASNFTAQVTGYNNSDAFNTKVFLRVDERTVQSLTNPYIHWSAQKNRALISDSVEFSEEFSFIPYAPICQDDIVIFNSQVWD